jgi:hypothetical protein
MGQENCGTDQTHYCRHCLKHLPTFLYATARQKTAATLHSQKDFRHKHTTPIDRGFCATDAHPFCDPAPRIWDFAPRRINAVQKRVIFVWAEH